MEETAQRNIVFDFEIISFLVLGLGLIAYYVGRKYFKRELDQSSPFRGIDLLLMFLPAIIFLIMPVIQLYLPLEKDPEPGPKKIGEFASNLVNLGCFAFVVMFTYAILEWIRNIRIVDAFGLKRLSPPVIILIAIFGGIASIYICGNLVGNLSQDYLSGIFSDLKVQDPVKAFQESHSSASLVVKIVLACVAAPLAEELIFRGYIYGTVKRFTSPVFAAVVSGALFAAAHGNLGALIPLWSLAILLVISYEWTKCLWVPIGIHAFFNAMMIIAMFVPIPEA